MAQHSILRVKSTPPTVEDALAVARVGIAVIPLAPGTKQPPKGFTDWKERATTDPDTIRDWWQTCPDANIGHVVQRHELAIDVDPRNNGLVGWHNLLARHGDLPPTWKAWSGRQDGGFHLSFTTPADIDLPEIVDLDQGVQGLGPRHLVVLPPSIHPATGQPYTWDADDSPFAFLATAPAPDWLVELVLLRATAHAHSQKRDTPGGLPSGAHKVPRGGGTMSGTLCAGSKPSPPNGPGARLVALACDPTHLPALLEACGLSPTLRVGYSTTCPMHDDAHPSASLLGPTAERRSYGLYCHASACKRYYSLTDIYHYTTSGNFLHLHTEVDAKGQLRDHAALRLQWTTRLLEAAGVLHVSELGAPTLPPHAPDDARDLWTLFLHVRRIRSATREASAPLPFSLRFIQDWAGKVYEWMAYRVNAAKRWLIAHGYLALALKDGQDSFWRVGTPALRRARREAPVHTTERALVADVAATVVAEPPAPTSACPDAEDPDHSPLRCELCRAQARILTVRRQRGIVIDYADPYGLGTG
jgi:Bifunctional DNA primase/polymerase, N-terminal